MTPDITDTILVTTGRKPAANTRRFAKRLAEFVNSAYINRGKSGLSDLFEMGYERVLVVGQQKGNPASLVFYIAAEEMLSLSISFLQAEPYGRLKASDYVITGVDALAQELRRMFAGGSDEGDTGHCTRRIVVDGSRIDFVVYGGNGNGRSGSDHGAGHAPGHKKLFSISVKNVATRTYKGPVGSY